jgi:hypothetical protein
MPWGEADEDLAWWETSDGGALAPLRVHVEAKSKDPRCRVGAVIISDDGVVLSTGFTGLARGVYDHDDVLADADEELNR